MEKPRFNIKVTPEAATALRRKAQDDVCLQGPPFVSEEIPFSLCNQQVQERFDAILQDERVDQFEAPGLFAAINFSPTQKITATDYADDAEGRRNALKILNAAEFILKSMLTMTTRIRDDMREQEMSYINFVSIENLWGMSPYLLGRPASALRLDAVNKVISELRDQQIGIEMLRAGITNGTFQEDNMFVRKFLSGPFKNSFNATGPFDAVPAVRGLVNLANRCESEEIAVMTAHYFEDVIGEDAMKSMLPEMSVDFWEVHGRRLANASVSLPQLLALTSGQLLGEVVFESVIARNVAVSALGRMGGARIALPGYAIFENTIGFGWRLPRAMRLFMNFSGEFLKFNLYSMVASGLGGGTGGEIFGIVYMGAVGVTCGYVHQWMRGILAELRVGQQNGVLAWHLMEDPIGPLAQANLSRELSQVETTRPFHMATDASAEKISGEITTLSAGIDAAQAQRATEAAERAAAAEKAAAQQALEARATAAREKTRALREAKILERIEKLKERVARRVAEAETAVAKLPEEMRVTFSDRIQQAATNSDLNTAYSELRTVIDDAREALAAMSRPAPRSRSTPSTKPATTPKGVAPRSVRMAEHQPTPIEAEEPIGNPPGEAAPAASSDPVPAQTSAGTVSEVENLIKHPPKELDANTLNIITGDIVRFDPYAMKDIQDTYRAVANIRGRLIRRLSELSVNFNGTLGKNWTPLAVKDAFRGKVGDHYRILVQKMPNGRWNIYGLEVRGHLKPNSDSWFPK